MPILHLSKLIIHECSLGIFNNLTYVNERRTKYTPKVAVTIPVLHISVETQIIALT